MMTFLVRAVLPALFAFFLFVDSAQAQSWSRADSKNFIVYSEGSKKHAEEAATNLERIDALMRMLLNIPREKKPHRLEVYVLFDEDRVQLISGRPNIGGFYRPTVEGSFIVAHRENNPERSMPGQVVLFHEFAHHLMFRYFTNAYPAWYREGFAEYLSTTEFTDKDFTIGAPANHRAYSIRQGSFLPIEEILDPPAEERTGNSRFMFYPQSWVLTHYLMSDSDRNRAMSAYFEKLAAGDDPIKAASATLGDLDDLESAIKSYSTGKIEFRRSPTPIAIDGTVKARKLDKLGSELVRTGLFIRTGYERERTRKELVKLAEEHPQNVQVLVQLAEAERMVAHIDDSFDFTAANAAVDRALAIDPNHEKANLLKASLLMEPDDHSEMEVGPVDWEAVRKHAITANKANAENPRALYIYVDSFTREGAPLPDIAIPAMEQTFGTVPEATDVRVALAKLHARNGNFDRALDLVGFLVGDPHNGDRGRELVAEIEAMRDGEEPDKKETEPTEAS